MELALLSAFVLYFSSLIAIGFYFYKKQQTAESFMLGDRSVNYYVTAVATQASDMGSWLFMGFPAMVYAQGAFQLWTAIGLVLGMWATWTFIAPKLREKTAQLDTLTLSSYFAHVFNDESGTIQIISSCFALLFFVFYIASGLVGLSLVFTAAFGISYHAGIILSLVTAALYTLVGGFVAVAWCDFFQGLFLLGAIVLVPITAIINMGGITPIMQMAQLKGISLSLLSSPSQMASALFLAASWGLGYFGQPHILVNFMGLDDPKKMHLARMVGMSWQIIVLSAAGAIGIVGIGFFTNGLAHDQLVFINLAQSLFHPFVAGLVLCAIFAATLSTMDSLILVSGATISQDIYKKFINPGASNAQLITISRIGSLAISAVALWLSWSNNTSIYELVNYAWSGLASTFGPLVFSSLYIKGVTRTAGIAGILVGGCTAALWPYYFTSLPLLPGFFVGLTTIIFLSHLSKK